MKSILPHLLAKKTRQRIYKTSRPRFWLYTTGPFILGIGGSEILWTVSFGNLPVIQTVTIVCVILAGLFYFLFPANLRIYGLNDIADGDTDKRNPKKTDYEQAVTETAIKPLLALILLTTLGTVGVVGGILWIGDVGYTIAYKELLMMLGLLLLSSAIYSLPPIRAKAKPFFDGITNVLYIIPGVIGFLLFGGTLQSVLWLGFLAGWCWSIAMHTYSAIPDIEPDEAAGLLTTAVLLGKKGTLLYCLLMRTVAALLAILALPHLIRFFLACFMVYATMIMRSWYGSVFSLYKKFPLINGLIGFILFWLLVLLQMF